MSALSSPNGATAAARVVAAGAMITVGVATVTWPGITLLVFSRLAGWTMALGGLAGLVEAMATGRIRRWSTLAAVAACGLGVTLLAWPARTLTVAAVLGGAWLIADGMGRVMDTVTARSAAAEVAGNAIGVVEALAGILVLARPIGGLRATAAVFGVGMFLGGGARLWRMARPATGASGSAAAPTLS